ncbi:MAG: hypothetical protein AB9866_18815 [Syntrophobacteraceae bacterium]
MKGDSEGDVFDVMQYLRYATTEQIADLLWQDTGKSKLTMAANRLNRLVELQQLERLERKPDELRKSKYLYRLSHLKGNGDLHALTVTDTLVAILKIYPNTEILREPTIHSISSRPDALLLIKTRQAKFPLILEVMHTETKEYLEDKIKDYRNWKGGWFRDRGVNHAGVLVIGNIELNEEGIRVAKKFDRRLLDE